MDRLVTVESLARAVARLKTMIGTGTPDDKTLFLAAHPVGSLYWTTKGNPAADYGGEWRLQSSLEGNVWLRVK